jgi:hypothetical protein
MPESGAITGGDALLRALHKKDLDPQVLTIAPRWNARRLLRSAQLELRFGRQRRRSVTNA